MNKNAQTDLKQQHGGGVETGVVASLVRGPDFKLNQILSGTKHGHMMMTKNMNHNHESHVTNYTGTGVEWSNSCLHARRLKDAPLINE
jgi:hypothetical protein